MDRRIGQTSDTHAGQGQEIDEIRTRDFFAKLDANLENDDAGRREELTDEFRRLILGG